MPPYLSLHISQTIATNPKNDTINTNTKNQVMVKLASARESRMYGAWPSRNQAQYVNAGLYVFAAFVFLCGFAAQLSHEPKPVLLLIALALVMVIKLHDLTAHLAAIDYRLPLMEFDVQLALVEVAVPFVQSLGCLLLFLAVLFPFIQGRNWVWFGIVGTLLFLIGGFTNVVKVFKIKQFDGLRLEKLRGGAQERLVHGPEGQVPLIIEEERQRKMPAVVAEEPPKIVAAPTPYKDVLVGQP